MRTTHQLAVIRHDHRAVDVLEVVMVRISNTHVRGHREIKRSRESENIHNEMNSLQLHGHDAHFRIPELKQSLTQNDDHHHKSKH